ncbi:MAG: hypothetical protein WBC22_11555 [Sedimentisphaerales bacterium]
MKRKEAMLKAGYSKILWSLVAVVLCAAPCVRADEDVPAGVTWDIPGPELPDPIIGNLNVLGTANLLTGASVSQSIYVQDGGTLNMYSGTIGSGWFISVSPLAAGMTVFGTDLAIDGSPVGYGEVIIAGGMGTLTGYYGDTTEINLWIWGNTINLQPPPGDVTEVTIDIKPGSTPNTINLGSNGVVPVAILSTETFDATKVLPDTVTLAGADVRMRGKGDKYLANQEDVNGDGLMDLVVKVETDNLDPGIEQVGFATLTGETTDGVLFEGSDSITIVPPE